MNDITKCYETLGLKPEASLGEVREAYRDLVKVWHPDRFAHDPKLQLKAQEKLKEINEAYQKIQEFLENLNSYQQATGTNRENTTETNTDTEQASAPDKNEGDSTSQPPPESPSASPNNAQTSHQEIRPWVRFWARTLDLALMCIPAALLLGLLLGIIAPKFFMRIQSEGGNLIFLLIMLPLTVLIEAIIIALFGNTPGKAILKTKITNAEGGKLSFTEALKRSLFIYFYGYALGFPIINLITYAWQHKRLKKTGKATWDSKLGFNVTHAHIGGVRIASAALLSLILIAGFGIINVATKETTRAVSQSIAQNDSNSVPPGFKPVNIEDIDFEPIQGTGVPTQPIDTTQTLPKNTLGLVNDAGIFKDAPKETAINKEDASLQKTKKSGGFDSEITIKGMQKSATPQRSTSTEPRDYYAPKQHETPIQTVPPVSDAYTRGRFLYSEKQYERAIEEFNEALKNNHSDTNTIAFRGRANYYLGKREDAVKDFSYLINKDPSDLENLINRGLAYYEMHDYEKALADLKQACLIETRSSDIKSLDACGRLNKIRQKLYR